MKNFSKEEVSNILVFIENGARSLSSQSKLGEASSILATADALTKKIIGEFEKQEQSSKLEKLND